MNRTTSGGTDDFRFASEPVVVDLDNDGHAEVIFTSWPKKATGGVGQLHVLDYLGRELYRVDLPTPAIGAGWNGSLGAPTIANIDSDPDLELVMGTNASGVVAYKLPNTANARVLWGTGRGNYARTGVPRTVTAPPPPDTTPPISLDGVFVEDFDTYFQTEGPQHTDFFRSGLAPGTHTLSIQVIGKNLLSSDFWILIDAFDVIP